MPRHTTTLQLILNRINHYQAFKGRNFEDIVRDIDTFLGTEQISYQYPFTRKREYIRVFEDVYSYAGPDDFGRLSFLDNQEKEYSDRARFIFNSFSELLQDKDHRNRWAEVWEDGVPKIGINYKGGSKHLSNTRYNGATLATDYTSTGDAGTPVADNVIKYQGEPSIRVPITNATDAAAISFVPTASFSDTNYQTRYFFVPVQLGGVPTSITIKIGADSSNYLSSTVTAQFDGSALVADEVNVLAIDLNTASVTGTFDGSTINYAEISFVAAPTGNYFLFPQYLRQWDQLEMWYSGNRKCVTADGTEQQGFYDLSTDTYSTETQLIGPDEWSYVVQFGAMLHGLGDLNDDDLLASIQGMFNKAQAALKDRFPQVVAMQTDSYWNFHHPAQPPIGSRYYKR